MFSEHLLCARCSACTIVHGQRYLWGEEENPRMSLPTSSQKTTLPSFNTEHGLIGKYPPKEALVHTEMLMMDLPKG